MEKSHTVFDQGALWISNSRMQWNGDSTLEEKRADQLMQKTEGQSCTHTTLRGAKETSFMNGEERSCDLFVQNFKSFHQTKQSLT